MYCTNCGAPLKDTDAKCPYCGTLNPVGAEAEYMEKLEDIREDTKELGDRPPVEYTKHLKSQSLFSLKLAGIVIAVILILSGIFLGIDAYQCHSDKVSESQRIAFQQKYFPKLDELYKTGDDARVSDYMDSLYDEKGSEALYNWKHSAYYMYYGQYQWITEFRQIFQNGKSYSDSDLTQAVFSAICLCQEGIWDTDKERMSPEELEKVNGFIKECEFFLTDVLGLTTQEIDKIYQSCQDDDYFDYQLLQDYLSENKDALSLGGK